MNSLRLKTLLVLAAGAAALSAAPASATSAAPASSPQAGIYAGTSGHRSPTLTVNKKGTAKLRYANKGKCGPAHGALKLRLRGVRFSGKRDLGSTMVLARGRFSGDSVTGTLRSVAHHGATAPARPCKSGKRHFKLKLKGPGTAVVTPDDFGHYTGASAAGRAVSFDLGNGGQGTSQIENFAVDVDTGCWGDLNHDGIDDTLLVHITGFEGEVNPNGSFDIYYSPDDDTEYEFTGSIANGHADLEATVGGLFDANGIPNLTGGPYECDNWGDPYAADKQG